MKCKGVVGRTSSVKARTSNECIPVHLRSNQHPGRSVTRESVIRMFSPSALDSDTLNVCVPTSKSGRLVQSTHGDFNREEADTPQVQKLVESYSILLLFWPQNAIS